MTRRYLRSGTVRATVTSLAAIGLLTIAACGGESAESADPPQETSSAASTATSERSPEVTSSTSTTSESSETAPLPSWDFSSTRSVPESVSAVEPPPPKVSLTGTDPCALLTEPQRKEVGLTGPTSSEQGDGSRSCEFGPPEDSGAGTSAQLEIHENSGLDEFTGVNGDPQDTTIAEHRAKIQCEYGNCLIGIAVADSSRVDVQSTVRGDDAATEQLGRRIAEMVIGNLSNV
ncbi:MULTISPECIES: DUF3558 family protein [Actinopolyspora]|uniref:DUF3558 domain-containing protein n=1 Tax=Actinopolyspora saharensis TaxID=995062 RepID=A0A1H1G4I1_9ACTN|nr:MULTISPECIES: DUF3558 family protein [Actinopolyspora]NHD16351.1 DUF3558 domain-containing protein [Actinopolyspora sp. BKK2]NHE75786.1 DUF3558 domain-containing protein [Actinopolyspora sp. BKK1]SDR08101.1 Protein of unknown function [Actinopolyspora saharensis]